MRKHIPFTLHLPEKYATDDLSIVLLPVYTTVDNPYSSNGDVLVAIEFSEETPLLEHLTEGSFILLTGVDGFEQTIVSMHLSIERGVYTFTPLSNIPIDPIVCVEENLHTLGIFGKVIFSYHDFANLSDIQLSKRVLFDFPERGMEL